MTFRRIIPPAAAAALFALAVSAQAPEAKKDAPKAEAPKAATPEREPGLYATFQTSMGTIVCKLFDKESPVTVKNFVDLAQGRKPFTDPKTKQRVTRPLYNGLIFHRVIPGFMIQGGDPLGTGFGGTDDIKDEFHPSLKFDVPGRLAMANAGPNTGSSQFFITEVPTPHLNGKHTIFGQVIEGQDLVGQIARVPRNAEGRPNTPVRMVRVTIQRFPLAAPKPAAAKPKAPATKSTAPAAKSTTTKSATPATKSTPSATKK
jgi:peptidyl-prolyl cis-trans isomerase A (cyclophilin A)